MRSDYRRAYLTDIYFVPPFARKVEILFVRDIFDEIYAIRRLLASILSRRRHAKQTAAYGLLSPRFA